jgi:polysaccharide biosynthesis protein PslG
MNFSQERSIARRRPWLSVLAATVLVGAVATSVLACGAGSTVAASGKPKLAGHAPPRLFGVQPGPTRFDATDAAKIGRTGIGTVRVGLGWLWVQPQPGTFVWTRMDQEVAALAAHGVQVMPTLTATPSWVASKPTTAPVGTFAQRQAWKTFVSAAVKRYGPGGDFWRPHGTQPSRFRSICDCSGPPVPITEWQVWNEPNLEHYFTPAPSPAAYVRLLRITRSAIKQEDRNAQVVMAGLSVGGTPEDIGAMKFLKRLYRIRGARKTFDAAAIHPYSRRASGMRSTLNEFRGIMRSHHDRRTPLDITEIGWGSAPPNEFGTTKGIRGQRRIVERSMKMLLHKRKRWHLQHVYWFFWRDPPKTTGRLPCRICYSAGLLRSNREPKPAYRAFKRIARPRS